MVKMILTFSLRYNWVDIMELCYTLPDMSMHTLHSLYFQLEQFNIGLKVECDRGSFGKCFFYIDWPKMIAEKKLTTNSFFGI